MASTGSHIPAHFLARNAVGQEPAVDAEPPVAGPSIGPPSATTRTPLMHPVPRYEEEEEDEDVDADEYAPALPPELVAARGAANPSSSSSSGGQEPPPPPPPPPRRTIGPAARGPLPCEEEEEESEDEIGPAPPPAGRSSDAREDAVTEFMQKEELRRQAIEEAARPKTLQRDEWMLVPPSSSDLLNTLDPTKLTKPRQFSRSTAPAKVVDNTLWTETPAERQQRLADEVMGRKRRVENADPDQDDPDAGGGSRGGAKEDASKRRKRDAQLQRQVDEYTRTRRGPSLLEAHAQEEAERKEEQATEEPGAIWDHARDMGVGGKLMDEKDRRRIIQDSKGLSDRFGSGKGGSFL